jgi:glycosyltransferase involved in cell wall biosynthesis
MHSPTGAQMGRRERVALFVPSLRGGGAERVMLTLAEGFGRRGVGVDLVLPQVEGPYLQQVPPGTRVVDLRATRVITSLPSLVRYLKRERPAALLATLSHANLVALWARHIARVPTRVVIREANTLSETVRGTTRRRHKLVPALARRWYPSADAIVAVSEGVARDLAASVALAPERILVLPNPIVTPELDAMAREPLSHPWFADGQPPVLVAVGRLAKQKDYPTLIRAVALVRKRRPVRLMVLGEGTERDGLEILVEALGMRQDVALPGFVPNPFPYMAHARVFVLSSGWEGMPGVLIQALACGAPVVATDCESGPRELLLGGRLGRLVPVGSVEALAQALIAALDEPPPPIPVEALEPYTSDAVVGRYLAVLGVSAND